MKEAEKGEKSIQMCYADSIIMPLLDAMGRPSPDNSLHVGKLVDAKGKERLVAPEPKDKAIIGIRLLRKARHWFQGKRAAELPLSQVDLGEELQPEKANWKLEQEKLRAQLLKEPIVSFNPKSDMGLLKQGIQAATEGNLVEAQTLFFDALAENEYNEKAWEWLSTIATTEEERQFCLSQAETARQKMGTTGMKLPVETSSSYEDLRLPAEPVLELEEEMAA